MTIHILHFLSFNGQWSHANDAYVTFLFVGTVLQSTNLIVLVNSTPSSFPFANQPHSLLRAEVQCDGPSSLASSLSKLFFFQPR